MTRQGIDLDFIAFYKSLFLELFMKTSSRISTALGCSMLLSLSNSVQAQVYNDLPTPVNGISTVGAQDTLYYSYGELRQTLNNRGLAIIDDMYIASAIHNYGNLVVTGTSSILAGTNNGSNVRIINYQGGNIVMNGLIDVYSTSGLIENSGRFSVVQSLGATSVLSGPFTYMFGGLIQNNSTGVFLFDRNNGINVCQQTGRVGTFRNLGLVEIASGTVCNFAENPPNAISRASYVQDGGETKVNGVFGANPVTINAGTLSGSGTIIGLTEFPLHEKVVISPGSPAGVGTLTFKKPSGDFFLCVSCSINIDIAGTSSNDRIIINGHDAYLQDVRLNVTLQNGYVPLPGSTFNVLNAYSVDSYGQPIYNLPPLPNGRTWSVENNGTAIILRAN